MEAIVAVHATCLLALCAYALHQGILLLLYLLKNYSSKQQPSQPADQPLTVTIQIPLFNERYVAERVIAAAAAQDYPRDKLRIQILDDSTDDTTEIAQRAAAKARASGVLVDVLHRPERHGYKAGALAAGLALTQSDLIAIFDADFLPPPDFLRRVICDWRAFADPRVGFVQTRWDYLNRERSALTRAQAMTLDVHFLIEQVVRSFWGLPMNFNGSAGIWRRQCILDAGGWQADTLTEDLDLSYRAALRGWRGVYLAEQGAPSELPADILAYKQQQARWARGTLQTLRKLLPAVLRSSWPLHHKMAALMHLSGYVIHPLILILSVTTPLLVLDAVTSHGSLVSLPVWVNALSGLTLVPIAAMLVAHIVRRQPLACFLRDLPAALMLGVGVAPSNTIAILRGLLHKQAGEFARTPKYYQSTAPFAYALWPDWTMWLELGLALYVGTVLLLMLHLGHWPLSMPLFLYVFGFGGTWLSQALGSVCHVKRRLPTRGRCANNTLSQAG
jgi:cellulose synthase/poly-beta-1,6-N-acetylglucosamine synthase-like glycosyltransferase